MIKRDKIIKLICGAGNQNYDEIEKLAYVYSCADFNMIDISADLKAIEAAKKGINKAHKADDVSICVSIGLKDDIHISKAVINQEKCNQCEECIKSCPQNAICRNDKIYIEKKKCIGCNKCIAICENQAIESYAQYNSPIEIITPLLKQNIDCIEFHCNSRNKKEITESFDKIKELYKGQLSICLNRSKLGDEEILLLLREMVKGVSDVIIQADGISMTGAEDNLGSNLQAVAFAQIIRRAKIDAIIILSGGVNSKATELTKLCEVKINGVAMGSFTRKLVKDYIIQDDFWSNSIIQNEAIEKARELRNRLIK